jgi:hypothetical protein
VIWCLGDFVNDRNPGFWSRYRSANCIIDNHGAREIPVASRGREYRIADEVQTNPAGNLTVVEMRGVLLKVRLARRKARTVAWPNSVRGREPSGPDQVCGKSASRVHESP